MQLNYQNVQQDNSMAKISAIMGFISVFLVQTLIIPIFLGSLAIILAILSKGQNKKLSNVGKMGFIVSIVSIILSLAIGFSSFWMYQTNPSFREETNKTFKAMTGYTMEEYFEQTGTDSSILFNK